MTDFDAVVSAVMQRIRPSLVTHALTGEGNAANIDALTAEIKDLRAKVEHLERRSDGSIQTFNHLQHQLDEMDKRINRWASQTTDLDVAVEDLREDVLELQGYGQPEEITICPQEPPTGAKLSALERQIAEALAPVSDLAAVSLYGGEQ